MTIVWVWRNKSDLSQNLHNWNMEKRKGKKLKKKPKKKPAGFSSSDICHLPPSSPYWPITVVALSHCFQVVCHTVICTDPRFHPSEIPGDGNRIANCYPHYSIPITAVLVQLPHSSCGARLLVTFAARVSRRLNPVNSSCRSTAWDCGIHIVESLV